MKCAHCGADLNSFQAYCMNCGAKVEQDQEVAATPVAEEAVTDVPETETETEAEAEAMDTAETAEPANEDSQPDSEPQEQQAQTAVAAQAAAAAAASATTRVYRDPFNEENQGKSNYRDPFAPQPNENNNYSQHYYGEKPVSMGNWLGSLFLLLLTPHCHQHYQRHHSQLCRLSAHCGYHTELRSSILAAGSGAYLGLFSAGTPFQAQLFPRGNHLLPHPHCHHPAAFRYIHLLLYLSVQQSGNTGADAIYPITITGAMHGLQDVT